ncbi:MAG: DUF3810 domain-containing protein [Lachnospiraceae bacterium]|nr:DUF3810 domain-containing protein [Lachnospiraceae bacterium]
MPENWKRWFWVLIPLVITLILQLLARKVGWFGTWYIRTVYPVFVNTLGRVMSIFPFSVVEIGLYVLILGFVVYTVVLVVKAIRKQGHPLKLFVGWIHKGLTTVALLLMVYTVTCGVNYYAQAFSATQGLKIQKSTKEELIALTRFLAEQVNEAAKQMTTDEDGCTKITVDVQAEAVKAMHAAAAEYPVLEGYFPKPKLVLVSRILSVQQVSGVYSPFTVEANVNREMTAYNIPFTACHELSHLKGFMREDEANFIAYLACAASDCAEFNYSGALLAYIYSGNALYSADKDTYWEIRDTLSDVAKKDLAANNAFWDRFETKIAEVHDKVNNSYLQSNGQSDGTKSYGRMVDLLLAMMRERTDAE